MPLKVMYIKGLEIRNKKSGGKWQNSSISYTRDNVSLVMGQGTSVRVLF